ncbi:MAG: membrane dipeptidase [Oscillospiraceae bacterium]|nr:membrane dipeptidase [Oscillospiraceae bacterium]
MERRPVSSMDLFDGHCDTIMRCYRYGYGIRENVGNLDLKRTRPFGAYGQFFALFGEEVVEDRAQLEEVFQSEYNIFRREMDLNRDWISFCRTGREAQAVMAQGKTAAFLSVEGADLIGCTLEGLEHAHQMGVRAINLTWNRANPLCGTTEEEPDRGLTPLGKAYVRRMQELGMLVDVSHMSDAAFWDVAELAQKPFVATHSNARKLCSHPRNVTDEMFEAVKQHGGTVGLNLYRTFLGEPTTVDTVVEHVEHFLSLGGEQTVAMGCDLDGCYDEMPDGITGVEHLEQIYNRMLQRNYKETLVHAVFFDNFMRVVNEVCIM